MPDEILVTGGAGFAGSHAAITLRTAFPGARVTALDNLHRKGSEINLPRLEAAGVRFVLGDVRRPQDLAPLEADLIIECSAEPSMLAGYDGAPDYLVHTNLTGCYHCLELARRCGAAFLFVSTSRVYPHALLNALNFVETETRYALADCQPTPGASALGISEDFPTRGARSLYGMTKLAAELMVEEYGDAYGLPYVINRCGLLAGPWQMGKADQGVITYWIAAHHFGRPLRYLGFGGSGKQVRDFLHIDDFCNLLVDQVSHLAAYRNGIYNVGGGAARSVSLLELTRLSAQVTGRYVDVAADGSERRADLRLYISDHRRVSAVRGWQPKRGAAQLAGDIASWIAAHEQRVREVLG